VIELRVLASGSRGNAAMLQIGDSNRHVMIDAGLSPRRTRHALESGGGSHHTLSDVLLTHGDGDHLHAGWARAVSSWGFTLHVHERHAHRVERAGIPRDRVSTFEDGVNLGDGIRVDTALAPHDSHGTSALVLRYQEASLGWATDLGRVDADLRRFFAAAAPSVMAIESNYDPVMQRASDRPAFLIERIMGGAGHLSNEEALDAVEHISTACDLEHIVLLHRSEQCNCPRVIEALWRTRAPHLADRMSIASQSAPLGPVRIGATTGAAHPT
jgi:phosphoribosyl 1,2-cyclic phosphodiesterase